MQNKKEHVKTFSAPSQKFLCPLKANKYALQFLQIRVRDPQTKQVFLEQELEEHENNDLIINDEDYSEDLLDVFNEMRCRTYQFPPEFFDCEFIATSIKFKVGDLPVKNLTLIDNHYFKNELIAQYEFIFPFCAPNSYNNWEYTYKLPTLTKEQMSEIIDKGEKTSCDTFFFAEDEMILHNKVDYYFSSN